MAKKDKNAKEQRKARNVAKTQRKQKSKDAKVQKKQLAADGDINVDAVLDEYKAAVSKEIFPSSSLFPFSFLFFLFLQL